MAEASWRQAAAPHGVGPKQNFAEAPACVQNAMLTKDKKPFTYTPGGIDLSEIRSPRMARRLEQNAMSEGVGPIQHAPHGPQRTGPLPPSALAAMQPQLPVQVFPSGAVPQLHPPPPPPPPMKPLTALPLDSMERPDMTKIIPDNPMAMLRKTSGPVVKQDPILNKGSCNTASSYEPKVNNSQVGSIYIPPVNQNAAPQSQAIKPQDSPASPVPAPPAFYKRQPSLQQAEPPQSPPYVTHHKQPPIFDTIAPAPESPKALPIKTAPWSKQKSLSQEDEKAVNHGVDERAPVKNQRPWSQKSLDKPDPDGWVSHERAKPEWQQQQQPWQQQQQKQYEPQTWRQNPQPEQQPWQQKQVEQQKPFESNPQNWQYQKQHEPQTWRQNPQPPEQQPWQQKQFESNPQNWQQPKQQHPQAEQPRPQQVPTAAQSPPTYMPQIRGVKNQIQNRENRQEYTPNEKVEVVIVNDPPAVFQHPGQNQKVQQRPQPPNQPQNVRIIPVQIERSTSNGHSDPRHINRQTSWNSTPTQSNTFKVLQKITHTDADDLETDQGVTEHSPKVPHNFPQQNTHRMAMNQSDQELMNKFKQGIDEDNTIHKEADPRYKGSCIPSKAFKLLQNMTSGLGDASFTVPQEQYNERGQKVRTIPIEIEGDGPVRSFIPPSEQTVAEPKKYMGSAIPSRSFKILQAMTAPNECGPGQSDL